MCVAQLFPLYQPSNTVCETGKQFYMGFIDLKTAYNRGDQKGLHGK